MRRIRFKRKKAKEETAALGPEEPTAPPEIKNYDLLSGGIPQHFHSAPLGPDGTGKSTFDLGHDHDIINFVVQPAGDDKHVHTLQARDQVILKVPPGTQAPLPEPSIPREILPEANNPEPELNPVNEIFICVGVIKQELDRIDEILKFVEGK